MLGQQRRARVASPKRGRMKSFLLLLLGVVIGSLAGW
jgi:hypothetical protein